MIRIFCNWCDKDATKKYTNVHIVLNVDGREVARQYHLCQKCTKEMTKLIRRDDIRNN